MKKALNETVKGTVVKSKTINQTPRFVKGNIIELRKDGDMFCVYVDKDLYKRTPNELFAVQVFNAI